MVYTNKNKRTAKAIQRFINLNKIHFSACRDLTTKILDIVLLGILKNPDYSTKREHKKLKILQISSTFEKIFRKMYVIEM